MMIQFFVFFLLSLTVSWLGCWVMIKKAAAWRLLKYPQGRGAHHKAVATSGGIIIIFPIVLLAWWVHVAWWLPMGMVLLAALGFADDHHDISFLKKLLCQLLLVLLVVVFLLPLPLPRGVFSFLQYVLPDEQWPLTNLALWVIFSVGWINFFNFMDGSDGHAGVQAILMLIGFFVFSDGSGFVSDTAMTVI
ncbi:MAG: hypothetical protein ORN57_02070, partial [Alphaproteobacteria bacterium]|nr:hypothetical protein [Alphaproteobacteria bacterium]